MAGVIVLILTTLMASFAFPEISGQIQVELTKYPGAEFLYSGYRIEGSADWQLKSYIYWTPDALEQVEAHYQRYYPEFTPVTFPDTPNRLRNDSTTSHDLDINLIDANQDHRSLVILDSYSGDPYSILDHAPRYGTLIVINTSIYAG